MEELKAICEKCERNLAKNHQRCPFRSISNDYCGEYINIEKKLKAFEIIKEKNVNISIFRECKTVKEYNNRYYSYYYFYRFLTETEFELLKKVL